MTLLLGAMMGLFGQSVRAILGLKKKRDVILQNGALSSNRFVIERLILSLLIGACAGVVGTIAIGPERVAAVTTDPGILLVLAAFGYVGTDAIEAFAFFGSVAPVPPLAQPFAAASPKAKRQDVFEDSDQTADSSDGTWIEVPTQESGSQSAAVLERTVFSLRQLYALIFILEESGDEPPNLSEETGPPAPSRSGASSSYDVEKALLPQQEWLRFEEISLGSFAALVSMVGKKWKAVKSLGLIFYGKGRTHLDRRVEANTSMMELEAKRKTIQVGREQLKYEAELNKAQKERRAAQIRQLGELMKLDAKIDKIKDPYKKAAWRSQFDLRLGELNIDRERIRTEIFEGATVPERDSIGG